MREGERKKKRQERKRSVDGKNKKERNETDIFRDSEKDRHTRRKT